MILGVGIDIVQIERVQRLIDEFGPAFANRILSTAELSLHVNKFSDARFMAKRFATKEAVAKALGTGIGESLSFKQITITKNADGKPLCYVDGLDEHKQVLVTLADEKDYVVAQALLLSKLHSTF